MRSKDFLIALAVVFIVVGICYGLAISRPPFQPTPSHPFSLAAVGPTINGRVVMRVNDEPVTEAEFNAAFKMFPEDAQRQFSSSEAGKMALAEQIVRMKLLAQQARQMGLADEPNVVGEVAAENTQILANAAAEKIASPPTDAAVREFYVKNLAHFETLDVSHILFAYTGGSVPPRHGPALSEADALKKAYAVYSQLRAGADFAAMARQYSDDEASATQGGKLGTVVRGMLPQELEARVFAIPTGQFGGPIPSQFGIHIFRVNARGSRPLDQQLRPAIEARVRQEHMFNRVEVLRKTAKVVYDPKFFPDARNWEQGKKKS